MDVTLTQLCDGSQRVVSYVSRKLSNGQQNYSANYRELPEMIELITHVRCYLDVAQFEIVTDNQVLKYSFEKKDLSRREARWLETLSKFRIFPITLKKGLVHVLGEILSQLNLGKEMTELKSMTTFASDFSSETSYKEH